MLSGHSDAAEVTPLQTEAPLVEASAGVGRIAGGVQW